MDDNKIKELAADTQTAKEVLIECTTQLKIINATLAAAKKAKDEDAVAKVTEEQEAAKVAVAEANVAYKAAKAAEDEARKAADPYTAIAEHYAKQYPKVKEFYVTTDMQVFLYGDRDLALLHQRSLGEGTLKTINL